MTKRLKNTLYNLLIIVLFIVGLGLFFNKSIRNTLISWNSNKYQVSKVSREEITENEAADTTFDFASVESISTKSILEAQMNAQKLPVVGGISIPDLGINLPIFKGLGNTELSYGAGTMKPNQVMGGVNNYALASHHIFGLNGETTDMLFSPLVRAKHGMKIYVTDKEHIYTYVISDLKVVTPEHVEVVDDRPGVSELTLVTCTDLEATERTIVHATLEGGVPFAKAPQAVQESFSKSYNQWVL